MLGCFFINGYLLQYKAELYSFTFHTGRVTINAFKAGEKFAKYNSQLVDENHLYNLAFFTAMRSIGLLVDCITTFTIAFVAGYAAYDRDHSINFSCWANSHSIAFLILVQESIFYLSICKRFWFNTQTLRVACSVYRVF